VNGAKRTQKVNPKGALFFSGKNRSVNKFPRNLIKRFIDGTSPIQGTKEKPVLFTTNPQLWPGGNQPREKVHLE